MDNKKKEFDFEVIKASGDSEPFSFEKFKRSVKRSGLSEAQARQILNEVMPKLYDGISTQELYKITYERIKKESRPCAARYSLKQSIRRLGPTGFPFEQLVAELLRHQGYEVETNRILKGKCVTHEVDALGKKNNAYTLVEAKFHQDFRTKTPIQTVLYTKARFDDVAYVRANDLEYCMLVTNAKFSNQVIKYGKCQDIKLLGWGYPNKQGIDDLINKFKLYPVTVLTVLSDKEVDRLLEDDIVLCKQVLENLKKMKKYSIKPDEIKQLQGECDKLCG